MTQQQIQQLFQLRYNQNNWKQFLSQAFSDARLQSSPDILTGINADVATQVLRLGYIVLNENGIERNITIYDVTLAPGIILERNRVGLRNLLRKYWKDIDAAFIVYHRPENPNWRFTYVSELTGFDTEGELIKVKTEPKRYTYILGEGESCRTAAERFAIITKKGNKTTLDDVKDAFSVEKLSKSFFDEYKRHYELFCEFMVVKPNIRQTIFNGDEKAIRDFNKKLLGRIVFLYFIQKKGWLGVPENSAWGQGDPDFLWNLFNNARNKGLFYSEYLTRLFFDTLNTPRPNDIIKLKKGERIKIPFLNGGLFEEDNKKYRNLIFPAELFENLFLFFNQYNFTIYEDDPNDHTVAVDPEMLGHIFENLLEDNKDKGAYYTPKEIVHYMCQESLIEYLCTTLQIEDEAKEKEAVTALLKQKEIDDILKPEIQNINDALNKVKICDPAIGSGAFPMGVLKEIFTAKQTLYTFEHGNTEGFDASGVKLNIIQNSIYGVDIEKGAVDIARLRFWLSLVVDEEAPKALPNLDYKIVVGNSLVSKLGDDIIDIDWNLNETSHGLFGAELAIQKAELLKKISKEQKEFFNPNSDKKKLAANIRKLKVDLLINQLELMVKTEGIETRPTGIGKTITKQTERYLETLGWKQQIEKLKKLKAIPEEPLQYFDWKLDFPEILNPILVNGNGGFDIVIGNPPYLLIPKEEFNRDYISYVLQEGKIDLYRLFIEKAFHLQKHYGYFSFIIPNTILTIPNCKKIREHLLIYHSIKDLINFDSQVFEKASVNSIILSTVNNTSQDNHVKLNSSAILSDLQNANFKIVKQNRFLKNDKFQFNIFLNDLDETILKKIKKQALKINDYNFEVTLGAQAYHNTIHSKIQINTKFLHSTVQKNKNYILELGGRNITSYHVNLAGKYVDYAKEFYTKPAKKFFQGPRIILREIVGKSLIAGYSEESFIINKSCYSIINKDIYSLKLLIAILNSSLIGFVINKTGDKSNQKLFPRISMHAIQNLPIKLPSTKNKILEFVDSLIAKKLKSIDTIALEQEIDNLVYKLYELTYEEVKVIDPDFELSKQEYEAI